MIEFGSIKISQTQEETTIKKKIDATTMNMLELMKK
jgi:hypothetical protein